MRSPMHHLQAACRGPCLSKPSHVAFLLNGMHLTLNLQRQLLVSSCALLWPTMPAEVHWLASLMLEGDATFEHCPCCNTTKLDLFLACMSCLLSAGHVGQFRSTTSNPWINPLWMNPRLSQLSVDRLSAVCNSFTVCMYAQTLINGDGQGNQKRSLVGDNNALGNLEGPACSRRDCVSNHQGRA